MAINTGLWGKALWPGINKWFGQEYSEHPVEYTDAFDTYNSSRNAEEDMGTSGFGLFQTKGESQGVSFDTMQQGFLTRYQHVTFGLGFTISAELFEDDLYAVVGEKRAKGLAFSIRQTKETIGANVYNRAFNSSFVGGDGVALASASHPNVAGGTYSNIIAVAADLSEAALEQARIDIMKYTNDRGLKISVMPQVLLVPVDLVNDAEKILGTKTTPFTAELTKNVVAGMFPKGVKVNHYFTDTDAWFIRTNVRDGLKYFSRRDDTFTQDDDFDTDNAKYKATFRCSFGWSDPRQFYGSAGA